MNFWEYFYEYLALPFLQEKGALAVLMEGYSRYLDAIQQDILWVRNQYLVPLADNSLISAYGESRNIPRTRYDTDTKYRTRVEKAFLWHKLGGKEQGLPEILSEYGYPGSKIKNIGLEKPELWAHLDINLLQAREGWGQEDIDAVYEIGNMYKPGRSIIGIIRFALNQKSALLELGVIQGISVTFAHSVESGISEFPPSPLNIQATVIQQIIIKNEVI